jgi:hypothetical protein
MSDMVLAARDGVEIEFTTDVPGRAVAGAKQMVSTSVARDYVDKGVARYTGVGIHPQWKPEWGKQ